MLLMLIQPLMLLQLRLRTKKLLMLMLLLNRQRSCSVMHGGSTDYNIGCRQVDMTSQRLQG